MSKRYIYECKVCDYEIDERIYDNSDQKIDDVMMGLKIEKNGGYKIVKSEDSELHICNKCYTWIINARIAR